MQYTGIVYAADTIYYTIILIDDILNAMFLILNDYRTQYVARCLFQVFDLFICLIKHFGKVWIKGAFEHKMQICCIAHILLPLMKII